jgi:hypothetical protein
MKIGVLQIPTVSQFARTKRCDSSVFIPVHIAIYLLFEVA